MSVADVKHVERGWKMCTGHSEKKIYLLNSGKYSDVEFAFIKDSEDISLKAHRIILADVSDVFEALFDNTKRKDRIVITDIEPDLFKLLLKYVYGDYIYVDSLDVALDLYKAASSYLILDLMKKCVNYLQSSLTPECAIRVYEFADIYEIAELKQSSMNFCKYNILIVCRSKGFFSASIDTLKILFQQGPFNIAKETLLLNAALKFADVNGISLKDKLRQMNEVFQCIKISKLSALKYADWLYLNMSKLQQFDEIHFLKTLANIFYKDKRKVELFTIDNIPQDKKKNEKFPSIKIIGTCVRTKILVNTIHNTDRNLKTFIKFRAVNFDELVGVQVSNQATQEKNCEFQKKCNNCDGVWNKYIENVNIEINDEYGYLMDSKHFIGAVCFDEATWIDFDEPIILEHNQWYTLSIQFNNVGCYTTYIRDRETKEAEYVEQGLKKVIYLMQDPSGMSQLILGLKLR